MLKKMGTKLKAKGDDVMEKTLQEINELKPVIKAAGFKLDNVELEMTLPPAITVEMARFGPIDKEALEKLAEQDLSNTKKAILKALVKAADYDDKLREKKLSVSSVSVKLSVPPAVIIKVIPIEDADDAVIADDSKTS